MVPAAARRYLRHGLDATPVVLDRLCAGITGDELDRRPDPERFTLREALAHMADWEPIWLDRIQRMRRENDPFLPSIDEGVLAVERDYAHSDAAESLARFRSGREDLSVVLGDLAEDEWERIGYRDQVGPLTIIDLAYFVLGHDGYHLRQIADFRDPV